MGRLLDRLFGSRSSGTRPSSRQAFDEADVWVSFDSRRVEVSWPGKPPREIPWDELEGVAIETNDEGPFANDVMWLLGTRNGVVPFPNGATGINEILTPFQELPDFDNEAVVKAMTSVEKRVFVAWDRQGRHRK